MVVKPIAVAARLPFDIYSTIISHLLGQNSSNRSTVQDVYPLLFVSLAWRVATEYHLYKDVWLPPQTLFFFARTILARSDLAARITSLHFTTAGQHPSLPSERAAVAEMFRCLPRLTDLEFADRHADAYQGEPIDPAKALLPPDSSHVLLGAPFRLTRLVCTFWWTPALVRLLREQPELREFALLGHAASELMPFHWRVDGALFAHCTRMTLVPHMLESLVHTPPKLTHARLRIGPAPLVGPAATRDAAKELRRLSGTLRVLFVDRMASDEYYPPAKLLGCFAPQLSGLVFLGLQDRLVYSPRDHRDVQSVICRHLQNLRVIVWAPSRPSPNESITWTVSSEDGFSTDSDDEGHAEAKIARYVRTYFERIPALRIFVVRGVNRPPMLWLRKVEYGEPVKVVAARMSVDSDCYARVDPEDPCALFDFPSRS